MDRVKSIKQNNNILWYDSEYQVAAPVISCTTNVVTMTCATTGATIRYSTNGGSSWSTYSSSITISATTNYIAYATKADMLDSVQVSYTATFTIDYFAIKNETSSANTLTLTAKYTNGVAPKRTVNLDYSYDGVNFTSSNFSIPGGTDSPTKTISIPANGTLYLRGNNSNGISFRNSNSQTEYITFNCSGNYSIQGDIMTLISKNGDKDNPTMTAYCFYEMFYGSTKLINALNCKLTSKTLAERCYYDMFRGCSNLVNAPEIKATTLANYCCYRMFYSCSKLTYCSTLLATSGKTSCYSSMFYGCSSLVDAPDIKLTSLGTQSMMQMFYNCTKLNTLRVHFTTWESSKTSNWTYGTKSTGTFYKPSGLASTKNASGNTSSASYIPYNWTVTNI